MVRLVICILGTFISALLIFAQGANALPPSQSECGVAALKCQQDCGQNPNFGTNFNWGTYDEWFGCMSNCNSEAAQCNLKTSLPPPPPPPCKGIKCNPPHPPPVTGTQTGTQPSQTPPGVINRGETPGQGVTKQ
jgi:hypothetical protein